MKKILVAIFLCGLFVNAQAQKPFTFGPIIGSGFNLASVDISGVKAKANGSFLGGAFARVNIKRFYIQPEIYYNNKVANFSIPNPDPNIASEVKTQVKTGNVNVNALVGVKLLKLTGLFNVRLFAGPSTSFLTAKSLYVDAKKSSTVPNLKSSAFNVQAGLGVDITKLTIDVRYEKGFTDIYDDPGSIKINSVLVTLGFKIL